MALKKNLDDYQSRLNTNVEQQKSIKTPTTSVQTPTSSQNKTSKWEEYKRRMDNYNVNAKADLSSIEASTNKYMDNYLNRYGLQGSGLGQGMYAQNAVNTQQQVNALNRNSANQLEDYRARLEESTKQEMYDKLANEIIAFENGNSNYREVQAYIDRLASENNLSESQKQDLEDKARQSGASWSVDKNNTMATIDEYLSQNNNNTEEASVYARLRQELEGAKTQEQYQEILDRYGDLNSTNDLNRNIIANKIGVSGKDIGNPVALNQNEKNEIIDIVRKNDKSKLKYVDSSIYPYVLYNGKWYSTKF